MSMLITAPRIFVLASSRVPVGHLRRCAAAPGLGRAVGPAVTEPTDRGKDRIRARMMEPVPGEGRLLMTTSEDRPELRVISSDDCYRLLATQQIGRLGVNAEHYPLIFPVNYALDEAGVIV